MELLIRAGLAIAAGVIASKVCSSALKALPEGEQIKAEKQHAAKLTASLVVAGFSFKFSK